MTATIRTITRRASGRESTRTTEVPKNQLTIGRATDCDIHLPDLRIGLRHARLTISQGTFLLEAEGDNEFKVAGRSVRRFEGRLGTPSAAQIGPYGLKFTEAAGRLVVDVELVQQQATAGQNANSDQVFSLRHTWLSKRATAWGFALLVAALFLVFPIATFATHQEGPLGGAREQAGQMWISGELSGPHELMARDCAACHKDAFVSVRDETCVGCHRETNQHAAHDRMVRAHGAMSVTEKGMRAVADTFNKPAGRCAECHIEHNGRDGAATASPSCTGCHNAMKTRLPDATVGDVSDFGRDHPEFRPTVVQQADLDAPSFTRRWDLGDLELARLAREKSVGGATPAATCDGFSIGQPNFRGLPHAGPMTGAGAAGDDSGLVFPHDVHLAERGCVASIAQRLKGEGGYGDKLECKDCHTPNEDGVGFQPINMERNCSACHSLVFDNVGGFERKLPHGRTNEVIATLLDFYQARVVGAALGPTGEEERRRPGEAAQRAAGFRAAAFANATGRAASRVRAVFAEGGACYGCHVVSPPAANRLDFKVAPVTLRDTFLPKAVFAHRPHDTAERQCEDCHEARTSKSSADVLVPNIASCQACHGGEHAAANVQSGCVMCHGFHSNDAAAPRMAPAGARKT